MITDVTFHRINRIVKPSDLHPVQNRVIQVDYYYVLIPLQINHAHDVVCVHSAPDDTDSYAIERLLV